MEKGRHILRINHGQAFSNLKARNGGTGLKPVAAGQTPGAVE